MRRYELTDEQWSRIEHLLPGRPGDPGTTVKDNWGFVHAVLWIARSAAPWRDLPERFGSGNSVFQRFNRKTLRESDNALVILSAPVGSQVEDVTGGRVHVFVGMSARAED